MATDRLQQLAALDSARLTPIVRRALASDNLKLGAWTVKHLSNQGGVNPEGLFLFSGEAHDPAGPRSWSVVLKTIVANRPELELSNPFHWQREFLAMEAGLLERLLGPLKAAQCYGLEAQPDGAWMWIEHIQDRSPRRWGMAEFAFAAEVLGRNTGRWLAAGEQPNYPWLARGHACVWAEGFAPDDGAWASDHVRAAWTDALKAATQDLWSQHHRLCAALDRLPQVFGHCDCQRRNLMIRTGADGEDELVVVDWAWCGFAPVGVESAVLFGNSMILHEVDTSTAAALDQAVFAAFLSGLRAEGWAGEVKAVRLAYCASVALFAAFCGVTFTAHFTHPDRIAEIEWRFGMDAAAASAAWADMGAIGVELGREALQLMDEMGM